MRTGDSLKLGSHPPLGGPEGLEKDSPLKDGSLHLSQRLGWDAVDWSCPSEPAPLFLCACVRRMAMAVPTLLRSSTGAGGAGAGAQCELGSILGWSQQASRSTRQFSICCLCTGPGSKQVCVCALQEWRLSSSRPSNQRHWFSNQLRGLIFPVSHVWAGVPNTGLEPLAF